MIAAASAKADMTVADYVLDAKQLAGKSVDVEGRVACLGSEICYIYDANNMMTFVVFDPSHLNREQRKAILSCGLCLMTITGKSGTVMLTLGIIASGITAR